MVWERPDVNAEFSEQLETGSDDGSAKTSSIHGITVTGLVVTLGPNVFRPCHC